MVLGAEEGERIAEALGQTGRLAVLQNHGFLTTGGTVDDAVYLLTLMERPYAVQIMAESTGLPKRKVNTDPVRQLIETNRRRRHTDYSRKLSTLNFSRTWNMRSKNRMELSKSE